MTTGEGSSARPSSPSEESPNSSPFRRRRGNQTPPVIGVRGQSAFTPYTRPPPSSRASGVGAQSVAVAAQSPSARKRVRDGPAEGAVNPVNCSVCGKAFMTPKALFGHMRSHPGRGWRGAHPPPTFRAEEEFADLRAEGGAAEDDDQAPNYRLPDLNNPPPEDSAN